jgi:hypothetical protein
MPTIRVLGFQMLILLLAFGLIGMWIQNAKGSDVTNCQGASIRCTVITTAPNPCDSSCSGFWPIKWCPDKIVVSGDGHCFDTHATTYYNCYERRISNAKKKKRRCDCTSTGTCDWILNRAPRSGGFFRDGDLICPRVRFTIC